MAYFSHLYATLGPQKSPLNIVCFGLPNAGKKSILVKLGKTNFSTLQDGTEITTVKEKNVTITAYPISSDGDTSPLLQDIVKSAHGLMFVCDSADLEQLRKAKGELHRLLAISQSRAAPLVVFANKTDLSGALDDNQLVKELGLHDTILSRVNWQLQRTCVTTGDGLYEGMEWMILYLRK